MALFINNIPQADPEVRYAGKTLPQDKQPIAEVPVDGTVQYAGQTLPQDKVAVTVYQTDPTNNPSLIKIGGYQLPPNTVIMIEGKKVITKDPILDGVVVFEHISRHPYEIEFDVVLMEDGAIPGFSTSIGSQGGGVYDPRPFPQLALNNVFRQVWLPDSVQQVENTYLNSLGILEIVIESVRPATIRGSKNIPIKIRAYENIPGQSIIVTTGSTTG